MRLLYKTGKNRVSSIYSRGMCAPTPLGSVNSRPPTSRLRKLRARNRAGAAHYRALGAIASFDSIACKEVGRRGNGPTGEAGAKPLRKPGTRSGRKGIRAVGLVLESSTGRSETRRARRVPHRWAAEVAVTLQGAEGDWKPRHQGDNPWVAVQLKPVTAGAIPAVRKAERQGMVLTCRPDALECSRRVSACSQPRGAESQIFGVGEAEHALPGATHWLGECRA